MLIPGGYQTIGGILALGLASIDASLETIVQFFRETADAAFRSPSGGNRLLSKVKMMLGKSDSICSEKKLERSLQDFFGADTRLFAPATSGPFQRTTRAAVTAVKDSPGGWGTQCLIANYNQPRGDWTNFEREDDPTKDMKIWEACRATSAAPMFFSAFRKGTTDYTDGATCAACPAQLALKEKHKIWPHGGVPMDILLSIGIGTQDRKWKPPTVLRNGIPSSLLKAIHHQLSSAADWEGAQSASSDLR